VPQRTSFLACLCRRGKLLSSSASLALRLSVSCYPSGFSSPIAVFYREQCKPKIAHSFFSLVALRFFSLPECFATSLALPPFCSGLATRHASSISSVSLCLVRLCCLSCFSSPPTLDFPIPLGSPCSLLFVSVMTCGFFDCHRSLTHPDASKHLLAVRFRSL